jgi:hypothetical protein
VSASPPLPPAARIEPATRPTPEVHTLPGWVAAIVYLACAAVLVYMIFGRLL